MEALIYFMLWAGLIFLVMRGGCGRHVTGHDHDRASGGGGCADNAGSRFAPPEKDADPVCGKVVRTATAKPSVHDGRIYYFCSRDCREVFEAAPQLYLKSGGKNPETVEHIHA